MLRWRHPERGLIAPGVFIDALADSPVAQDVGYWVLDAACERASHWHKLGFQHLRIGVNLFPSQFLTDELVADVKRVLSRHRLPASSLELEITENIAFEHDERILATLQCLASVGCQSHL